MYANVQRFRMSNNNNQMVQMNGDNALIHFNSKRGCTMYSLTLYKHNVNVICLTRLLLSF